MPMPMLDIDFARRQFPAFEEPSLYGVAHFDNAGGSYACRQVIERLDRYYRQTKMQPYGPHSASRLGGEAMDSSYAQLAPYLGVPMDELHLGPSTSQNTYVLAQAFAQRLAPGDEIIVTDQDHEANSGVWRRLAARGLVVKEWTVDPATGALDPAALAALLSERTRVVAFTHCSNILGQINDVAAICRLVHDAGAFAVVDGVSYAGHGFPDVAALGADAYLFSLYKAFGPHLGAMTVATPLANFLGNQGHYFNENQRRKWFVPAGPDHAQVAAAGGVADYFDDLHRQHFEGADAGRKAADVRGLLRQAELKLLQPLLYFARDDPRVRLLGPSVAAERAATVSMQVLTATPGDVAAKLAERGIIAGAGHFYAVRLIEAMGLDADIGVLRLSFVHYTSREEIERVLEALDAVL